MNAVDATAVARNFAAALDAEDYARAAALLAPGCRYSIGDRVLVGPEAIVASYRENGDWVAATLDGYAYESSVAALRLRVAPGGGAGAVITFVDLLEHAGHRHRHTCRQHLTVNAAGRIAAIEHEDLPGEPEKVRAFFDAVGIERGSGT